MLTMFRTKAERWTFLIGQIIWFIFLGGMIAYTYPGKVKGNIAKSSNKEINMKIKRKELDVDIDLMSDEEVTKLALLWNIQVFECKERVFYLADYEFNKLKLLLEDINGFITTNGLSLDDDVQITQVYEEKFHILAQKPYPVEQIRYNLKKFIAEEITRWDKEYEKQKQKKKKTEEDELELYKKLKEKYETP